MVFVMLGLAIPIFLFGAIQFLPTCWEDILVHKDLKNKVQIEVCYGEIEEVYADAIKNRCIKIDGSSYKLFHIKQIVQSGMKCKINI